jgi:hypothetical protein
MDLSTRVLSPSRGRIGCRRQDPGSDVPATVANANRKNMERRKAQMFTQPLSDGSSGLGLIGTFTLVLRRRAVFRWHLGCEIIIICVLTSPACVLMDWVATKFADTVLVP